MLAVHHHERDADTHPHATYLQKLNELQSRVEISANIAPFAEVPVLGGARDGVTRGRGAAHALFR